MTAPRPSVGTRLMRVRSVLRLVLYDVVLAALFGVGMWVFVSGSTDCESPTQYLGMALAGVALWLSIPDRSYQRLKDVLALLFPNGIPLPLPGGSRAYDIRRQPPPPASAKTLPFSYVGGPPFTPIATEPPPASAKTLPPGIAPPAEDAP